MAEDDVTTVIQDIKDNAAYDLAAEMAGVPEAVISIFQAQADTVYFAFLAGKKAALIMCGTGEIEDEEVVDVAMKFANIIAMKVSIQPPPSQLTKPDFAGKIVDLTRTSA